MEREKELERSQANTRKNKIKLNKKNRHTTSTKAKVMRDYSSIELWYLWIYNLALTQHTFNETVAKAEAQLHNFISGIVFALAKRAIFFFISCAIQRNSKCSLDQFAFHPVPKPRKKIRRQRVNTQCAIWLESETKETWTICWFHFDFRFWAAANRPPTISSYLEHTAPQSQSEHPKGTRCESWMRL